MEIFISVVFLWTKSLCRLFVDIPLKERSIHFLFFFHSAVIYLSTKRTKLSQTLNILEQTESTCQIQVCLGLLQIRNTVMGFKHFPQKPLLNNCGRSLWTTHFCVCVGFCSVGTEFSWHVVEQRCVSCGPLSHDFLLNNSCVVCFLWPPCDSFNQTVRWCRKALFVLSDLH